MYGSKRVGMYAKAYELMGAGLLPFPYTQTMSTKQERFELTDHLGNIATVVTGSLLGGNGAGSVNQAEVVSAQGYEPFGAMLPERSYSSNTYRFGFQGQEKDDEMHGATGTSYAFEYRMHDPRVGRFLSIDPLAAKYPWNSPYAFSENRVIDGVELEGLERHPFQYLQGWLQSAVIKAQDAIDIVKAGGRGLDRIAHNLAPIRPADENDPKNMSGAWDNIKQIPSNIVQLPKHMQQVYQEGSNEQKIEETIALVGTVVGATKGKASSINGLAQASFKIPQILGAGRVGTCIQHATDFIKKAAPGLRTEGAIVERFEINIGKNGLIGTAKEGYATNGIHQFMTVEKDGMKMVYDNMNPSGISFDDYVKSIGGHIDGAQNAIEGTELIGTYATKLP